MTRLLVPGAALRPRELKDGQLARPGSRRACEFVPLAAVRVTPLHGLEACRCRLGRQVLVDRAALVASPAQQREA
eukprot:scaffold17433_cov43-Prasinocladus_malaysianus.AAC.1